MSEIYADILEHPLLQKFNDFLKLLSLSCYVNFLPHKMSHILELGMLLNLHHSNTLVLLPSHLFPGLGVTEDFSHFSCDIYQLPRALWCF